MGDKTNEYELSQTQIFNIQMVVDPRSPTHYALMVVSFFCHGYESLLIAIWVIFIHVYMNIYVYMWIWLWILSLTFFNCRKTTDLGDDIENVLAMFAFIYSHSQSSWWDTQVFIQRCTAERTQISRYRTKMLVYSPLDSLIIIMVYHSLKFLKDIHVGVYIRMSFGRYWLCQ